MELPQEIEAFYVLPAVRRELAKHLVHTGLTQRAVAQTLGVTEAAISQYLANKRGTLILYPKAITARFAEAAQTLSRDKTKLREELTALCHLLKTEKVMCELHKKHATVPDGCQECYPK